MSYRFPQHNGAYHQDGSNQHYSSNGHTGSSHRAGNPARENAYTAHMERTNDMRMSDLHSKVSRLKEISVAIGDEVRDSNRLLTNMDQDMSSASALVRLTTSRLNKAMKSPNGRLCWYLTVFVVVSFFLMYFLVKLFK